jgi:hypothetical protein
VLIKSHVLITFLFLVSLSAIQRRASDEPGKGSKDRSNVRAETREDGAHCPIWQARPSVQPPAGWSKLGGVWRKSGAKARAGLGSGEGSENGANVSNFGPVSLVNLPNSDPVHIQNLENLQVFHRLAVAAQLKYKKDGGRHDEGFD